MYSPHLTLRQEPVHVDVAILSQFVSKLTGQLLMKMRREVSQGILQSQLKSGGENVN